MIHTPSGPTPNLFRSARVLRAQRRLGSLLAALVGLYCVTGTVQVHAELAPEPAKKLCQPAADGQWNCSDATASFPRQRNGAPVPPPDTRIAAPAPARQPRTVPVAVRSGAQVARTSMPAAATAQAPPQLPEARASDNAADPNNSAQPRPKVRILAQPRTAWAIQLIATQSREALERIAEEQKLYDHPAVRLASGNVVRYALIWDVYPDRASAEAALNALPAALHVLKPWLRPIGPLQDAMNEATRISPLTRN